jgi:hypothetical protein
VKLIAPDAKRTPVVTRQMPSSFEGVISSPRKIMPPNIDKIGVIAPKAAVCAAPNCLTAYVNNSIAKIPIITLCKIIIRKIFVTLACLKLTSPKITRIGTKIILPQNNPITRP